MEHNNGSGAATNSGIDYQQRVSAWFLAMVFTRTKISPLLGFPEDLTIKSVAYENATCVDDLSVKCTDDFTLYLQIKRNVCLSTMKKSEFYKTMDQFVRQFVTARNPKAFYILATSSDSSGAITKTLKKLMDSCRLNPKAFADNPLSKAEKGVLASYKSLIQTLYNRHTTTAMTEAEFVAFARQVYISVLDVESGGVHETAAKTLMAPLLRVSPDLIWALLISNSLHYAKSRFSITSQILNELLNLYRVEVENQPNRESLSDADRWKLAVESAPCMSSGMEVVLVESFMPEFDFLILEFFRFDEQCKKRIQFSGSEVIWGTDKIASKVIRRTATSEGMRRYCDENTELFKDKTMAVLGANGIEGVEETPCACMHAEFCARMAQDRKDVDKCLHCGKPLSQQMVTLVELDDSETSPTVGGVHDECIRPVDRVLGYLQFPFFENRAFLKYFDLEKWTRLLLKGQRLFNDTNRIAGKLGPIAIVVWNPENEEWDDFNYCVKINLTDGSSRYLTSRGRLDRYPKQVAETRAKEGTAVFSDAKSKNDPFCYTSINWVHGNYSRLLSIKEEEEECIECISAEAARYTEHIGREYATDVQFYTPLLYFAIGENQMPFVLNNHMVFLTSPLDVGRYLQNWSEAGVAVGPYENRIVESDQNFDKIIAGALSLGLGVVVDPLIDRNGQLVKGHVIVDMETAISMGKARTKPM